MISAVVVHFCNASLHKAGPRHVEKVTGLNNQTVDLQLETDSLVRMVLQCEKITVPYIVVALLMFSTISHNMCTICQLKHNNCNVKSCTNTRYSSPWAMLGKDNIMS